MADLESSLFELDQLDFFDQQQNQDLVSPRGQPTFSDYMADLWRAPVKGASMAIQGLLQLGAIPIDYASDTNLTSKLEDLFQKYSPDTKTGLGDIVATIVQFGVPLGVASKIGSGMKVLKGATRVKKLAGIPTTAGKATELVRRAGYWGTLGGITDLAVSVPGQNITASEAFGFGEEKEDNQLEGRERAAELLKEKFKFGAEGATVAGAIPLLGPVASVGAKYGLVPAAKGVGYVGGKVLKTVDYTVVNPLSKIIAGKGSKSFTQGMITKSGELMSTALSKTGMPAPESWKYFSKRGTFSERLFKTLDNMKNKFTTAGIINPALKAEGTKITTKINAEMKNISKYSNRIDNTLEDIVTKFRKDLYIPGILKRNGTTIDTLQYEKNKIFDYLKAKGPKAIKKTLDDINPAVRNEAKELKNILKESNTKMGNLLSKSKDKSYQALAKVLISDADNFIKQRLASFNNPSFKFDPTSGTVGKAAKEHMKKLIKGNRVSKKDLAERVVKNPKKGYEKILDEMAEQKLLALKRAAIDSGDNIKAIVGNISEVIGKKVPTGKAGLLDPTKNFPDTIKKYLSVPKGQKAAVKTYQDAIIDTVTYNSQQMYSKQYFDLFLNQGLGKTVFTKQQAVDRGIFTAVKKIKQRGIDPFFESKLFNGKHYTLPEVTNALLETKVGMDNLFKVPFYKHLMTLKAGAQIGKTVFSPMTQIRNVTTASFFPLASGLIGGRASLAQSWKLVADDIFTGAKTNLKALNSEIDDMVTRGVIDQNIQVNEIRAILSKAQNGTISFESFLNNPTVKKFVDVYQGGDNIWKVYSDKFYQSALKDAFGDPKATPGKVLDNVKDWYRTVAKEEFIEDSFLTGTKKTADEALKEVSAHLVTNTIPTYSKVPQIIKNIRVLPFGNFIAFPAEILRTSSNLLTIGARELTSSNPFIRQMGARRLIGASMTFGGVGKVVQETAEYVTGVTPDQMDAFQRSFAPEYQKNSTLIPLTQPDENGKFKYFNFSYTNPYNSLVTPINAMVNAFADGTLNKDNVNAKIMHGLFGKPGERRSGALMEFFSPFIDESIGTERVMDIILRDGKKREGGYIFYPEDSTDRKIAAGLDHIIGGLTPGAFNSAQRVWEGATGKFTDAGTARNSRTELAALMSGIRVEETKPLASLPFIMSSYNREKQNIGSAFAKQAYSARTSTENKLAAYKDYISKSFDSQNRMFQLIKDAEAMGLDDYELKKIFKERLTDSETRLLFNGTFRPPTYSKERIKSLIKRLETEDPEVAFKIEDQFDTVEDIFKEIRRDLRNYDLGTPIDELKRYLDELLTPGTREARGMAIGGIASLPQQAPNAQQQAPNAMQNFGQRFNLGMSKTGEPILPTGLTRIETALLRPYEQAMRLRERGLG
jgi:hypothetical protein